MNYLPVNMATRLVTSAKRSSLDVLAEPTDKSQELSHRSCVHAVLTKMLEKLELLVSNPSLQHSSRH
ncbi:unnamed protein product [Hymenolepis diminuta]|uniref:Uncharacterized protein n=1 Tax=Hymenolepis diminuta TaxID=6216 RepID=A0A564YUK6_HYMDI|nr:unnamed protein product [Hymenolepis diminuta]